MKSKLLLPAIFSVCLYGASYAQGTAAATPAKQVQPKIMVIPRVKDGEDMKVLYDADMNIQIALSKVNEALLKRGANLIPFAAKLAQAKENLKINQSSGNQEDFKSMVLQMSGSDIYVETKLDVVKYPARNASSVTIILEGYQNGTSNLLGSKVGTSRINQTPDIGLLTAQAMDSIAESFLNLMQLKFDDIVANGQSVYVEFSLAPDSKYNFDSDIGTEKKLLSEVIEEWFQKHAVNGVFNSQGVTGNKMIFSDVRIPLKNPANPNANYNGQSLYNDLLKYLRTLDLKPKREISTNNKIIITIQ